jgi:hypothetical protein
MQQMMRARQGSSSKASSGYGHLVTSSTERAVTVRSHTADGIVVIAIFTSPIFFYFLAVPVATPRRSYLPVGSTPARHQGVPVLYPSFSIACRRHSRSRRYPLSRVSFRGIFRGSTPL